MPDLQNLLDQIDRLDQEATKGPWHQDGEEILGAAYSDHGYLKAPVLAGVYQNEHDAEFISLSRTALPQLAKAVKTILSECESFEVAHDDEDNPFHQGVLWTVMAIRQAITDAIGDHDDD